MPIGTSLIKWFLPDLLEADQDRLIERDGETFRVTDRGRPFVRTIAACFDAYIDASTAHHAPGV
jgi:oxygen-independent coproporphyrinogen-3 oxidase